MKLISISSFHPLLTLLVLACLASPASAAEDDFAPPVVERQLPKRMHSAMPDGPRITVGRANADIIGTDNRALQAAVEYVAALGGGTVEIGPGTYAMHDSLHLRPRVTVLGAEDHQTVLRKAKAVTSALVRDGDYGEEQATVKNPAGFDVGWGVTIWDKGSGGFHTTVARITGRGGNTFSFDKPLNADCMVGNGATAATVFPVVSGYDLEGCRIEQIVIDGNKNENPHLNGCRGAGIFLYRGFGTVIEDCVVRNFNGDGLSFQQSNDVVVRGCVAEDNTSLGFHPGSGSQRPLVEKCLARRNGEDGLFLCWRVRHGVFQDNVLEANGRFGISIGHKDSDNLLRRNQIRLNDEAGICFRNETEAMAGHRNRLEANVIENNGVSKEAPGIRVRGETNDLTFTGNIIRETRQGTERKQTVGVVIEEKVGAVALENNAIEAATTVDDRRRKAKP
jgi:Right handed beta helix region